jgi:hypothetical protein
MQHIKEAHCHVSWPRDAVDIYMLGRDREQVEELGGHCSYARTLAKPVEFVETSGSESPEPTCTLTMEAAQQLMDQLWVCGLRPTEGTGSAGSLAATEKHLNDMRAIVSKQLEVQLNAVQR